MLTPVCISPGKLNLIAGPRRWVHERMQTLIVQYALHGTVRVVVGGNRLDVYDLAYALAAKSSRYYEILETGIHLARAETCYQMAELLKDLAVDPNPTLVTDFLAPFYEEGVAERVVDGLLHESIQELLRLSTAARLVVSASPHAGRGRLIQALTRAAGEVEVGEGGAQGRSARY